MPHTFCRESDWVRPVIQELAHCQTLAAFAQACQPLQVHAPGRFLHLELDIVNRCNLQCVMCYHSLEATRVPVVYLDPAVFAQVAAVVLPHASHLSLSLGNEALMSPHFVAMLERAAPYQVPHVNFFTNALLLHDTSMQAIVRCGVTQVCISVDGATAKTYNAIRRGGDFDDLLRKVERLMHWRSQLGASTPRLRFDVVMMRRNAREWPAIVQLAARLGVQQISFRHLVSFAGLDMEQERMLHAPAVSDYWLAAALQEAHALGLEVQTRPAFFGDAANTTAHALPDTLPTPYCPFPFFHLSMGPGGHVLLCPHAHGQGPVGQVSADTPIDKLWLGPALTELRQRILLHDPPAMCRRCPYLADHHPNHAGLFATREH